jgi:hypothetical protein
MDAASTRIPAATEIQLRDTALKERAKGVLRTVIKLLSESTSGRELDHVLTTPAGAQFAALPKNQQNQLLNRGYRSSPR